MLEIYDVSPGGLEFLETHPRRIVLKSEGFEEDTPCVGCTKVSEERVSVVTSVIVDYILDITPRYGVITLKPTLSDEDIIRSTNLLVLQACIGFLQDPQREHF